VKLKKEGTRAKFRDEIKVVADKRTNGNVDSMWTEFRECLIATADKTCGRAKRKNKKRVTWWWNKEVSDVVKRKRKLYRVAHRTKTDEDREAYNTAKREAKIAVAKAKESESRRYGEMLDKEDGRKNIFRIAKQMVNQNKDVIGSSYIKGKDGNIITDESKVRQTWKEYFDNC
jgi:glycyl-tRNA synthetase beta subunit